MLGSQSCRELDAGRESRAATTAQAMAVAATSDSRSPARFAKGAVISSAMLIDISW